jgi:valyl-tRNA synthetase
LRAEKQVPPSKKIAATLVAGDKKAVLEKQSGAVCSLANIDPTGLTIHDAISQKLENQVSIVTSGVEIYLPLADLIDPVAELERLSKELDETNGQIERLDKLLSSDFGSKAPPAVVEKERIRLAQFKETAQKLEQQLAMLKK